MRGYLLLRVVGLLAALLPLALLAAPALAADPVSLKLEAPREAGLGDNIRAVAELRDGNGAPVPGATIILWTPASFLSVGGSVRLGEAPTDAQGRASFQFQARSSGALTLNAYFAGDSRYDPVQGSTELSVQGSAQLYQQEAGVRVWGIGVWLLVGLVGTVWAVYLGVMVLLTLIAREEATSG